MPNIMPSIRDYNALTQERNDLLAALIALVEHFSDGRDESQPLNAARAVIAKAERR